MGSIFGWLGGRQIGWLGQMLCCGGLGLMLGCGGCWVGWEGCWVWMVGKDGLILEDVLFWFRHGFPYTSSASLCSIIFHVIKA